MKNIKSKKIGTISLNINTLDFNYGAILHSWAFQKYLSKEHLCDYTEIIDYKSSNVDGKDRNNPLKDAIKNKKLKYIIKNILIYKAYQKKLDKFNNFIKNNMQISSKKYNQKTLEQDNLKYDTIICESDVIWSPGFFGGRFDKAFFLSLKNMENMKKIAYAPSMANGDLTNEQEKELKEYLKNIDYISCRETYQKEILEKYTDKKITHVLDPVLLLDAEDYTNIISHRIIEQKYMLLYLPVDNNKNLRKEAQRYAKKNNLKILEISTNCRHRVGHKTLASAGVEEFLSAIKYADCVFTNSFHAICFSLIFNKEFYAFSRKSAGKVKNICDIVGLSERFLEDGKIRDFSKINYEEVNDKVKKLKTNSQNWIKEALNN